MGDVSFVSIKGGVSSQSYYFEGFVDFFFLLALASLLKSRARPIQKLKSAKSDMPVTSIKT